MLFDECDKSLQTFSINVKETGVDEVMFTSQVWGKPFQAEGWVEDESSLDQTLHELGARRTSIDFEQLILTQGTPLVELLDETSHLEVELTECNIDHRDICK